MTTASSPTDATPRLRPGGTPPATMNAIVVPAFGEWRYRTDVPVPEPAPGQVRLLVAAAGICGTDVHMAKGHESLSALVHAPVVQGHEFCGHVDKLGAEVSGLTVGDFVSAEMHEVCGDCPACLDGSFHACAHTRYRGLSEDGCFADYVCVSAANVVLLPEGLSAKAAAFLDPLGNAVHCACKVPVAGRKVMVTGYGAIGAMVVEVVAFLGAAEVHVLDVKPEALERARARADAAGYGERLRAHLVDRDAHDDQVANFIAITGGGVDVGLELSGHPNAINDVIRCTRSAGHVVLFGIPSMRDVSIEDLGNNVIFRGLTLHAVIGRRMFETWKQMLALIADGLNFDHLVTSELPLSQLGEGYRRIDAGGEQKVVLYPSWDR